MESVFQFSNPVLSKLNYSINEGFDGSIPREIEIKMEFSSQVMRDDKNRNAIVSLTCKIGEPDENAPFYIEAEEQAHYRWGCDSEGKLVDGALPPNEVIDSLLKKNAPTLLLSYLRPMVSTITAASPFGTYNIPFMDFSNGVNPEEQRL